MVGANLTFNPTISRPLLGQMQKQSPPWSRVEVGMLLWFWTVKSVKKGELLHGDLDVWRRQVMWLCDWLLSCDLEDVPFCALCWFSKVKRTQLHRMSLQWELKKQKTSALSITSKSFGGWCDFQSISGRQNNSVYNSVITTDWGLVRRDAFTTVKYQDCCVYLRVNRVSSYMKQLQDSSLDDIIASLDWWWFVTIFKVCVGGWRKIDKELAQVKCSVEVSSEDLRPAGLVWTSLGNIWGPGRACFPSGLQCSSAPLRTSGSTNRILILPDWRPSSHLSLFLMRSMHKRVATYLNVLCMICYR